MSNRHIAVLADVKPILEPMRVADIVKFYQVRCQLTNGEIETSNYISGRDALDSFNVLAAAVPKIYLSLALLNRNGEEIDRR